VGGSSSKNEIPSVVKPAVAAGLTQTFYKGEAKSNIDMIIGKMKNMGITNPMVQVAILATIGKESGFIPQNEVPYTNTDNSTIRKIFSSTKGLSDRKLDRLKKDPEDFFNYVYGPEGAGPGLGNTQRGDGYKYRGRGFNQITGRSNYKKYGYESNPDDLNDPDGAADAMLKFLAKEGSSLNDRFKSADEALEFFVTRNAGGTPTERGESKAREVLAKFNVGSEPGGDLTTTSSTSTPDNKEGKKKSILDLLGLGGLDAMIDLVKGDEKSFASSYGKVQKESVNEEVHRIKDIMKKIL
jgi:predicted chitinase